VPAGKRQGSGKRNTIPAEAVVLVLAGIVYALLAAATTPFSTAADIATGVPIIVMAVLAVWRWPLRPRPLLVPVAVAGDGGETRMAHPWRAWIVLFGVVVAWELAEYAARGSRADHPTFSSMTDAVDRYFALKALLFFLWLALGAAIVRAGARRRRPEGPGATPVPGLAAGPAGGAP
jgi:hypothetical protein